MEILKPEASWFEIDPEFYRHGGTCLNPAETEGMDARPGQAILVAPAGNGEEALSFINLGAEVTVLDESRSLPGARSLAAAAGMTPAFVEGDPAGPAAVFGDEAFDAVYTPWGTLDALPLFDHWAESMARVLRPGGRLVIYDRHPISSVAAAHKGLFVVGRSYFHDEHDDGRAWTLGDLVSSLGAEGLATMLLEEFPDSDRFPTPLDSLGLRWDVRWRLPAAMLLVAIRVR
ncbi:MAG TPA: methyltransferase domain-containing protein [Tepidiformaceae bacterium]|jgi:SAM-dependent methyltransferase|nr:methyltransferase domain-containing protein [Tepidiformaceae bacterium]